MHTKLVSNVRSFECMVWSPVTFEQKKSVVKAGSLLNFLPIDYALNNLSNKAN